MRRSPRWLTPEKLARTFDYTRQLGNVDAISSECWGVGLQQVQESAP